MMLISAAVVAALVGVVFLVKWLRHHVVPRNFGVVEPGCIFRSGRLTPRMIRRVRREHGIRTIIDLGAYPAGTPEEQLMQRTAEELGLTRYVMRGVIGNATGNPNVYLRAIRLLADESSHPVLIHCAAGAERTGAAVILFRHLVQGKPIDEVYKEALCFKHDPAKNRELRGYVERHAPAIREAFERGGDIPDADPPDVTCTTPVRA
ncbi:MAG: tyrosine-protein phosphatase [Phycisphaerae bacterium]|nr:tyrosine-protein phosphatase [Phycisphaerae bacterium]